MMCRLGINRNNTERFSISKSISQPACESTRINMEATNEEQQFDKLLGKADAFKNCGIAYDLVFDEKDKFWRDFEEVFPIVFVT